MSELTIDEIRGANDEVTSINEDILEYLNLRNSMNARTSFGGTSSARTHEQVEYFYKWLKTKEK
jgi:argininosuccinate lyase